MIVKTKKYQLDKGTYTKIALKNALTSWWWVFLIPVALIVCTLVFNQIWWAITGLILTVLYILFWYIQFAGVSYLEQFKMIFENLSYEIDSRQILIKLNPKQGMPVKWEQIKTAKVGKNSVSLFLSRAHFIHLPQKIFKTENDYKFVLSILKRKGLIK